jgi:hypothetical protein
MVVVGQDNAPPGTSSPDHVRNDGFRMRHMLKKKPRVHEVKGSPFIGSEIETRCIARSKVDKSSPSGIRSQTSRLGQLCTIPFDSDDRAFRAGCLGHGTSELTRSTSQIKDALPAAQVELPK